MDSIIARAVHIRGLVQGVGFRPFVYRLASRYNLAGWVENGNDGVRIHAQGSREDLDLFIKNLKDEAPLASQILEIRFNDTLLADEVGFSIRKSSEYSDEVTEISPDIAVCQECLNDMESQHHRLVYPFINCTNCGPRFSIIKGLPYDRAKTTMHPFVMCPECLLEYNDVNDRRFHAQPVACNNCGPHYTLHYNGESWIDTVTIINKLSGLISDGKIIAIKGIGGFHLACNALDEQAVNNLRRRKIREGKPFAVMFKNIEELGRYAFINQLEAEALTGWRKPILILKNRPDLQLAGAVSNGFATTGAMLPYMPIHYLLFDKLNTPAIVLTSGNISDEPVIIDNDEAVSKLSGVADAFLLYNRDIYNRTDDSVAIRAGNSIRLIRRSRGYAPSPVNLPFTTDGIFASGAELVNCFCVGKDNKAIISQHTGDLKNLETLDFYRESVSRYLDMFRAKISLMVCDLHPDYLSTRFAEEMAENNPGTKIIRVQHHHAHLAACMAEHNLDEEVIGICMDGVGYGADGNIWGFEAMTCDLNDYKRIIHLEYIPQPGGDKANHEPWRMAYSYLKKYVCPDPETLGLDFLKNIGQEKINLVKVAIEHSINCPLTSSAGRLFDAVAAMTGLCNYTSFHAEAPMRLEDLLDETVDGHYSFSIGNTIDPGIMIKEIVEDLTLEVPAPYISAKFHNTVVNMILKSVENINNETGINKVVLSGGTFQNRYILEKSETKLRNAGFQVYSHSAIPSNDGGISLGQLVIAARRRQGGTV